MAKMVDKSCVGLPSLLVLLPWGLSCVVRESRVSGRKVIVLLARVALLGVVPLVMSVGRSVSLWKV